MFSAHLHILYFVAFAVIVAGLILYNLAQTNCCQSCRALAFSHVALESEHSTNSAGGGGTRTHSHQSLSVADREEAGATAYEPAASAEEAATEDELAMAVASARAAARGSSLGAALRSPLQDSETSSVNSNSVDRF